MSDVNVNVTETNNLVTIDGQEFAVAIEELSNLVTVDESDPNNVFIAVAGAQGVAGGTIISGSGNPTSDVGNPGDIYINTVAPASFWGPKHDVTGWPATPFFQLNASRRHVHEQDIASAQWDITHNLGGYPSIMVVDSSKTVVIGEVTYIDEETIRVNFTGESSGYAYLT